MTEIEAGVESSVPKPSAEAADLIAEILDDNLKRWNEKPGLALCCCTEDRLLM